MTARLEPLDKDDDDRRYAASTARNWQPILQELRAVLPRGGTVVEIASGTGEHAVHFARALPHLIWQPTDRDPEALASIAAWQRVEALPNLRAPIAHDLEQATEWPVAATAAIVAINLIHIAPWSTALQLFAHAGRELGPGQPLFLYGAYFEAGVLAAPSNLEFDATLRARDPSFGVRQLETVLVAAARQGLALSRRTAMPSHNLAITLAQK